jgi:hypothetical protein
MSSKPAWVSKWDPLSNNQKKKKKLTILLIQQIDMRILSYVTVRILSLDCIKNTEQPVAYWGNARNIKLRSALRQRRCLHFSITQHWIAILANLIRQNKVTRVIKIIKEVKQSVCRWHANIDGKF